MADIHHDFPIRAPRRDVWRAITSPAGLDAWWTIRSRGEPRPGTEYQLGFGPGYDWRATVLQAVPEQEFELQLTRADADWTGTRVGFQLAEQGPLTLVRFHHTGWPLPNDHYRTSSFCWAMYLRVLRVHLERGESIPYEERLDA